MKKFTKQKSGDNGEFSQDDSVELGLPLPLLRKWEQLMQGVWRLLLRRTLDGGDKIDLVSKDNQIYFARNSFRTYLISINFVNHEYLQLSIEIVGDPNFSLELNGVEGYHEETVVRLVAVVTGARREEAVDQRLCVIK
jgi:hypothetical protein